MNSLDEIRKTKEDGMFYVGSLRMSKSFLAMYKVKKDI